MASEQLAMIVDLLKANRPTGEPSVEEMRAGLEAMVAGYTLPDDVKCERVVAGGVPAEWVSTPGADPTRVILYLHGGGYVVGSINTHRDLAQRLSRAAAARVLLIDYRLAPEHPHPAAVEDALAAYRWLLSQGVNPSRLVVAGDSAGGGLTVATLVAARDAGLPLPAAGLCLSPWVDLEGIGESMTSKADVDPMVQRDGLRRMAEMYLNGQDPRTPLAAPLYADLSGLPPLFIQVGSAETLLDDATRLAERARKGGGRSAPRSVERDDPRLAGVRQHPAGGAAGDRAARAVRQGANDGDFLRSTVGRLHALCRQETGRDVSSSLNGKVLRRTKKKMGNRE